MRDNASLADTTSDVSSTENIPQSNSEVKFSAPQYTAKTQAAAVRAGKQQVRDTYNARDLRQSIGRRVSVDTAQAHPLSFEDMMQIQHWLTPEQISVLFTRV